MIILLIVFLLVLAAVEYYSRRHGLERIFYDVQTSRSLLEPDEEFTIHSTIENHKFWFVPYVSMSENFPLGIHVPGEEKNMSQEVISLQVYAHSAATPSQQLTSTTLSSSFYLMPKQKLMRSVTACFPKRGRYLFLGCNMHGGDFLGIKDAYQKFPLFKEVVVMPRQVQAPQLERMLGGVIGDISVNRFIFEDPMLTVGFSEYTGREPMRDISWTQSARLGRMMVKNYDHTVDLSVTILLNVQSVLNVFEDEEKIDECCSLIRSVCEQLEQNHIKYRLMSNAIPAGSSTLSADTEQGLGSKHFYRIMELLGRVSQGACESFSFTLRRACLSSEQGRYHILVTPTLSDSWKEQLHQLQELTSDKVLVMTPELLHQSDDEQTDKEGKSA